MKQNMLKRELEAIDKRAQNKIDIIQSITQQKVNSFMSTFLAKVNKASDLRA